jgi:hypothetical protein
MATNFSGGRSRSTQSVDKENITSSGQIGYQKVVYKFLILDLMF